VHLTLVLSKNRLNVVEYTPFHPVFGPKGHLKGPLQPAEMRGKGPLRMFSFTWLEEASQNTFLCCFRPVLSENLTLRSPQPPFRGRQSVTKGTPIRPFSLVSVFAKEEGSDSLTNRKTRKSCVFDDYTEI
jgi:hypothetical protein